MKRKGLFLIQILALLAAGLSAFAQGTAFTYQGRLSDGGSLANGIYDLQFVVYDRPEDGRPVADPITSRGTDVSNGLFTVTLDFQKDIFTGEERWLEISVSQEGQEPRTLAPRQQLTATPYAITARNLTGPIPSGSLGGAYPGVVTFNNAANSFSGSFAGNGGGLSNLSLTALGPPGSFDYMSDLELAGGVQHPTGGTTPTWVAVGDVNGDGRADLAIANAGSGTITIQTNTGAGFAFSWAIPSRVGAGPIILADLNRDGFLDVVCGSKPDIFLPSGDNSITVSRGLGNGTFTGPTYHNSAASLNTVAVGDLNGDTWPDIVAGANNTNVVSIFVNDAAGNFPANPSTYFTTATANPVAVALAEMTGDGRLDLITAHGAQGSGLTAVAVYPGNGLGFNAPINLTTGSGLKTLAVADVNRDGWQDIIVGNGQSGARVDIFLNSGPGSFSLSHSVPTTYVNSLTVGDFNGDSWPDVAVTDGGFFGYTGMRLMLNDGSGRFAQVIHLTPFQYRAAAAGDLDGDGLAELIAPGGGDPGVVAIYSFSVKVKPGLIVKAGLVVKANASFQENVGIGAPVPQQLLHLNVTAGHGEGMRIDSAIAGHAPAIYLNHTGSGGHNFRIASFGDNSAPGSFRIRDDTPGFGADRLVIDAVGNVGIGTIAPTEKLHVAGNILASGTITPNSDRRAKTAVVPVDSADILERVSKLPISQWRFKAEADSVKHIGPMAQDFHTAFGLGAHETAIATVDADGVALAAIQGLNQKLEEQLKQKNTEIHELKERLAKLEQLVNR